MIVIGYPGVGKTRFTKHHPNDIKAVDLESSCFIKDENWARSYVNVAIDLSNQGNCVFVSSHDDIRKELIGRGRNDVFAIYPSIDIKEEWIKNLHDRYEMTKLTEEAGKNYRAWERAEESYEDDIKSLMEDSKSFCGTYVIHGTYNMLSIIDGFYATLD